MAGSRSRPRGLLDHLTTAWTLLPVTALLSVGIIAWALDREPWEAQSAFLGSLLVGVGSVLTQVILASGGVRGDLDQLRRELVESLELVERPDERPQPADGAERIGTAAPAA